MGFSGLNTCASMVLTDCDAESDEEVITLLSELARDRNYVNEIFKEKILEREREFPTGLPMEVPIAIPHVHDGCLESFFSVAVMKRPVAFQSMDGSEEPVMTRLVFLFGITDPRHQTEVLKRFCTIFQNAELLQGYIAIKDRDLLLKRMTEDLGGTIWVV
ncbi:MAG TPA: PTS sugar transporter subunit IIA [Anaerovoracaceae bacterium]|nr:PTS sugar transporter subunit IIA [Anaerovoracaceae bacterium]